jgi:hypothetical protein
VPVLDVTKLNMTLQINQQLASPVTFVNRFLKEFDIAPMQCHV